MQKTSENCRNCDAKMLGEYCSKCGQKKFTRIDLKYLISEFQYTLIHTNKGFLYSLKKLIINPGKSALEFIDGKRINHYKPILLCFLLSSTSVLLYKTLINYNSLVENTRFIEDVAVVNIVALPIRWSSFIYMFLLPVFSLPTFLALRKQGHNYFEHIILNTHILSFYLLSHLFLVFLLFTIFGGSPQFYLTINTYTYFLLPLLLFWFYKSVYKDLTWKTVILKVLRVVLFVILTYALIVVLLSIAFFIYASITGANTLNFNIK